jgi:hypothetical protein
VITLAKCGLCNEEHELSPAWEHWILPPDDCPLAIVFALKKWDWNRLQAAIAEAKSQSWREGVLHGYKIKEREIERAIKGEEDDE